MHAQLINRVEYYFDTDPGFGSGISIPITPTTDLTLDFTIPLNTVSEGFHLLYLRAKSNGFWSVPVARSVFVQRSAQTATTLFINHIEYFFDSDPGPGNGISIPITAAIDVTQSLSLPLNSIADGFHIIYFRGRTTDGRWSIPVAKTVFVQQNAQTSATPLLRQIEYFIDTDPGLGNGTIVSLAASTIDQLITIDLSASTNGFHLLYMRSQDVNGRWSLPVAKPFFAGSSGSNIVTLEYYYFDGTTKSPLKTYSSFTPDKNITTDFAAVLDGLLPNTSYEIHITAINEDGQRSAEVVHTFLTPVVICDPLIAPTTTGASICIGEQVSLTATGATGSQIYQWYSQPTGGASVAGQTGSSFVTSSLTTTTTYYVSIKNGTCESNRTPVMATILNCNQPPVITTTILAIKSGTAATFDLLPLLSDPDNNIDLNSLRVSSPPTSGAMTSLVNNILTIDYTGIYFSGKEKLEIEICDLQGSCTQQFLTIDVSGELIIYNGLSPNGDGKNDFLYIAYIDLLTDTKTNTVTIYNRWGDVVFKVADYDNIKNVFTGENKNGNQLPSGVYFYKIDFGNLREGITGYITLKR